MGRSYKASWSARVGLLTALGTIVLLGEAGLLWVLAQWLPQIAALLVVIRWLYLALLVGCALLTVRKYSLDSGTLKVRRLLWSTELSLDGLSRVSRDPTALRMTIKGFGNSGLFAILGWRYVTAYGWCRVFATNPRNAVILECSRAHYIVTPDNPDIFVREARQWLNRS